MRAPFSSSQIVITRHGRAIAGILPECDRRQAEVDAAIRNARALREQTGKVTIAEFLSARDEAARVNAIYIGAWARRSRRVGLFRRSRTGAPM